MHKYAIMPRIAKRKKVEQMTFETFEFKPFITNALKDAGFSQPTEVQQRLIPLIQKKKSVVGQSQTGTGKTHTFLLPLMDRIDPTKNEVQVVVTAPSRELPSGKTDCRLL